jgi:hypothetical protein
MAEVIRDHEVQGVRRYPWDEWCDGNWRRFIPGEDFDIPIGEFRNRFYTVKSRRSDVKGVQTCKQLEAFFDGQWRRIKAKDLHRYSKTREVLIARFERT